MTKWFGAMENKAHAWRTGCQIRSGNVHATRPSSLERFESSGSVRNGPRLNRPGGAGVHHGEDRRVVIELQLCIYQPTLHRYGRDKAMTAVERAASRCHTRGLNNARHRAATRTSRKHGHTHRHKENFTGHGFLGLAQMWLIVQA